MVKPNRINVEVGDIRRFLEVIADIEGLSLAIFGNQLIKRALKDYYIDMTIADIVSRLDPVTVAEKTGMEPDRAFDIAAGSIPSNAELVMLARELKHLGIVVSDLGFMRDRDYATGKLKRKESN